MLVDSLHVIKISLLMDLIAESDSIRQSNEVIFMTRQLVPCSASSERRTCFQQSIMALCMHIVHSVCIGSYKKI